MPPAQKIPSWLAIAAKYNHGPRRKACDCTLCHVTAVALAKQGKRP